MEKQKLPNGVGILVLSILGIVCCCIPVIGIIFAVIAFFMANSAEKTYKLNPDLYENYSQIKTGKIIAIVAIVLNILNIAYSIYSIQALGGWDAYMEQVQSMIEAYQ